MYNFEQINHQAVFDLLELVLKRNKNINALQFTQSYFENYDTYRAYNFKKLITKNTTIKKIIIINNYFDTNNASFDFFLKTLRKNKSITDLKIINCHLQFSSLFDRLVELISSSETIESLTLRNIKIENDNLKREHLKELKEAFQKNKTIKHLTFASGYIKNYITFSRFCGLVSKLENLESLEIFKLFKSNKQDVFILNILRKNLSKLKNFKQLKLPDHRIFDNKNTSRAMAKLIHKSNIVSLDISQNGFNTRDKELFKTRKSNAAYLIGRSIYFGKLQSLNLDCTISDRNGIFIIKVISKYIENNENLKNLSVRHCHIINSKRSLRILSDLVRKKSALEFLDLSYNGFCRNPRNIKTLRDVKFNKNLNIENKYDFLIFF